MQKLVISLSNGLMNMNQIAIPNDSASKQGGLVVFRDDLPDTLALWAEAYFRVEVTTSERSQQEQKRDIQTFLDFMWQEEKSDARSAWTPRLSRAFMDYLKKTVVTEGQRRWSDRTINRMFAHLKTWAKWIHKIRPFPLGNPMEKIKGLQVGSSLDIERALTPGERRRLLDAADLLLTVGGLSKDRRRSKGQERTHRKGYRPYRNRAIVYALIETGMRRAAICNLNWTAVDGEKRAITVEEKGGHLHTYHISQEGLQAIKDYLNQERTLDAIAWQSAALFLPAANATSQGRLGVQMVNSIWNEVCELAKVEGKTPHSARHAMGRHIMDKTGNVAAVQRQLGHKNAAYSLQYSRITAEELNNVLDER